jgi:hypothetical protein
VAIAALACDLEGLPHLATCVVDIGALQRRVRGHASADPMVDAAQRVHGVGSHLRQEFECSHVLPVVGRRQRMTDHGCMLADREPR